MCRACAGNNLFLWDPHGRHLAASSGAGANTGVGHQYSLAGDSSLLLAQFKDQFAPWDFAGPAPSPCTLIRLPLRTPGQAQRSDISKVAPSALQLYLLSSQ